MSCHFCINEKVMVKNHAMYLRLKNQKFSCLWVINNPVINIFFGSLVAFFSRDPLSPFNPARSLYFFLSVSQGLLCIQHGRKSLSGFLKMEIEKKMESTTSPFFSLFLPSEMTKEIVFAQLWSFTVSPSCFKICTKSRIWAQILLLTK